MLPHAATTPRYNAIEPHNSARRRRDNLASASRLTIALGKSKLRAKSHIY